MARIPNNLSQNLKMVVLAFEKNILTTFLLLASPISRLLGT